MTPFELPSSQLSRIADEMASQVREGFSVAPPAAPGAIRHLLTWLNTTTVEAGEAIAIDSGGTWLRAARVELPTGRIRAAIHPWAIPKGQPIGVEAFFDEIADRIAPLLQADVPIGWVWSFPGEATPEGDVRHLAWTKEFPVRGDPGLVGERLKRALASRGHAAPPVRVLNDTVATLLSSSAIEGHASVGLVVGTGHNLAIAVDEARLAGRLLARPGRRHIVNLECGNFDPGTLSAFDDALDAASGQPGWQRLEKAVSGHTLGTLYRAAGGEAEARDAGDVVAAAVRRDPIAISLVHRSADLVAAAVAGAARAVGEPVSVVGEGSVFWSDGYPERFLTTLARLGCPCRLAPKVAGATTMGAAIAARTAL